MDKKTIPIFYAGDQNFIKYTAVSISSLILNASKNYNYKIYLLHSGIDKQSEKLLTSFIDDNFEIKCVDVKDQLVAICKNLPLRDYYSKTTYFRLFIPNLFPEYEKAIYIDSDTIVKGDISQLFNNDLSNNLVGACHEQVMIQTEIYGNYVEKVLGISRMEFFNAGVLLINCKLFREENIFNKFLKLLETYDFVVTQDEDYLNILCKARVKWLDQSWNTEVYGEIPVEKGKEKIVHYIMVSKPWHYRDCRYSEDFWKYAVNLPIYHDIVYDLNNYTDEEKNRDLESVERLASLAQKEINRDDNYLSVLKRGRYD